MKKYRIVKDEEGVFHIEKRKHLFFWERHNIDYYDIDKPHWKWFLTVKCQFSTEKEAMEWLKHSQEEPFDYDGHKIIPNGQYRWICMDFTIPSRKEAHGFSRGKNCGTFF